MRRQISVLIGMLVVVTMSCATLGSAVSYQRVFIGKTGQEINGGGHPPNASAIASFDGGLEDEYFLFNFPWHEFTTQHMINVVNPAAKFQFMETYPCDQVQIRYVILNQTQKIMCEDRDSNGHPITSNNKWAKVWVFTTQGIAVQASGLLPSTDYNFVKVCNGSLDFLFGFRSTASGTYFGSHSLAGAWFWMPDWTDWTLTHPNPQYRHPVGARVWILPRSDTELINQASSGHSQIIIPSTVNRQHILFETDYVFFPPQGEGFWNFMGGGTIYSYQFLNYYGKVVSPGQVFSLPKGQNWVIIVYWSLLSHGLLPDHSQIWSSLDALYPCH